MFLHVRGIRALWWFSWLSCSNSSMSFWCWGPQCWMQDFRWDLTGVEQNGAVAYLHLLSHFWCNPGYNWLSGLQKHITGLNPIFLLQVLCRVALSQFFFQTLTTPRIALTQRRTLHLALASWSPRGPISKACQGPSVQQLSLVFLSYLSGW